MKIKISFLTIIVAVFFTSYCQAQYNALDSIKKCLFGEWVQKAQHGGQTISFDTTKLIVTITSIKDSISIYPYIIKGDSLFVPGKYEIQKARITFVNCDLFTLDFQISPSASVRYTRRTYRNVQSH